MKILITGSTGLVGTALALRLQHAGHTICRLIRPGTAPEAMRSAHGFDVQWNPDAVFNLAGASIAGQRWTPERKQLLRTSRVETTRSLVSALAKMSARPRVFLSASATGYYGNRGDELLTEESIAGTDLLSEIAREWETEALKAEVLGIRVVRARVGVILAKYGGALPRMMRPFQFGVGGKLGSGRQWMSWITLDEAVAILLYALENSHIRGPLNVVSPQPLTNTDFTKILAATLDRPALFPAPPIALRLALGEMADALLLSSQRAVPAQLQRLNYPFQHPDLRSALTAILAT